MSDKMLEVNKYGSVIMNGEILTTTGFALSCGQQNEDAKANRDEMVKRWNQHDTLTNRVKELEAVVNMFVDQAELKKMCAGGYGHLTEAMVAAKALEGGDE